MEQMRKPLQGVLNIIRFNWHFYAIALGLSAIMLYAAGYFQSPFRGLIYIFTALALSSTLVSLLVSFYVYDASAIYRLDWIGQNHSEKVIVNINAGFDETSHLLQEKFKHAKLIALDFYHPEQHTEVSIKRARKAYPPYPGTKQIATSNIELEDSSADKIFVILAAHEIRDEVERIAFFEELRRIIKPTGQIYITEHLRDLPNFLAYTLGFFHFYAQSTWLKTFYEAHLFIRQEIKLTPFISTFILEKNGDTL
jgi:SAM-dependent methyltransferase